jgi:hypothetical protein
LNTMGSPISLIHRRYCECYCEYVERIPYNGTHRSC